MKIGINIAVQCLLSLNILRNSQTPGIIQIKNNFKSLSMFKYRIQLKAYFDESQSDRDLKEYGINGMPHMTLFHLTPAAFHTTVVSKGYEGFVRTPVYISHSPTDRIMAKTQLGMNNRNFDLKSFQYYSII